MTSNIGARQLKDFGQGIGFNTNAKKANADNHSKGIIQKALKKHNGRRKNAAKELGISERTLYRKIKEYEILK